MLPLAHPEIEQRPSRVPAAYLDGLFPARWQDADEDLAAAIRQYIWHRCRREDPPSQPQIELIVAWLRYYLDAPCWQEMADAGDASGTPAPFRQLRAGLAKGRVKTISDLTAWVTRALATGIDPF